MNKTLTAPDCLIYIIQQTCFKPHYFNSLIQLYCIHKQVSRKLKEKNYKVINVDGTIIAQEPKMKPHIPEKREKLAAILKIAVEDINIKATTEEGLGFTGAKEGISAQVIVMIDKRF